MKKTLSLGLIAISIFFIACNKENEVGKINAIEELESSGKIAEEVKIEDKTVVEEAIVTETKTESTVAPTKTTTSTTTTTAATQEVVTPVTTVKNFTITAQKWSFSPATITVNNGDTVKLSIKSTDVDHGFFLADFGVSETLKAGTTTNVSFIANKSGTFSFSCSVFCGSSHSSMVGTLIVK